MLHAFVSMLALTLCAAAAVEPPIGEPVTAGITLIPGGFPAGRQPDGNTVIFSGTAGLVVFDTGRHPEHAQQILDYATRQQLPILTVVNSHWHLDHISGNARLRAVYPQLQVFASSAIDAALTGFLADSRRQGLAFLAQPGDPDRQAEVRADIATIDSGAALLPDVRIEAAGERVLAGRRLQVGLERWAVTAADVWLYDPATRVLASGDLVTLPVPFFDTACPARWQQALARLETVDFATLVPGHGAPLSRAQFATYRSAFDALLACAASASTNAQCSAGWLDAAASLLNDQRERSLARALVDYYLTAILRGDDAKRAALCGAA